MTLEQLFRRAVKEMQARGVKYAVAGGFAMDLYRREPRLTMDVDFAILTGGNDLNTAREVIESLGLRAGVAREADLAGGPLFAIRKRSTKPCMVVGRPPDNPSGEGVDILLPAIAWVEPALERAESNQVDFGFGNIPVLSLEDAILSKLYALKRLRAKDIDDLQSICEAEHEVDIPYLSGQIARFEIEIPSQAKPFLPEWIIKLCSDSRRTSRARRRKNQP
jgi:hypothetical protein